jgi:hydrogenase expression/formation protein HypE
MNKDFITIGHGSGGKLTHNLIKEVFRTEFGNSFLDEAGDAALLPGNYSNLAFTTDSYVIDPIFFPGGNIGKLAVCGTINDLCVSGAIPKYMSLGVILEEGFSIDKLKIIAHSIAVEAHLAEIKIVAGDTKVVNKGQCDKIFLNTSCIGIVPENCTHLSSGRNIEPGDIILLSGNLGDHAIAILSSRENLVLDDAIESDSASLLPLTSIVLKKPGDIHFMRDITRGGLATVLSEICSQQKIGIEIEETCIPVNRSVRAVCDLYGFDPMYLANEGKMVVIIKPHAAKKVLESLKKNELGCNASIIGRITSEHPGKVIMNSLIGGKRILDMLSGEMLPRIC